MKLALLAVLMLAPACAEARGFDWFGVKSGMTADQVRAAAPAGAGLRLNGDFGFVEKAGEELAALTFCKGRLVSLSKSVDPETEWFAIAGRMLREYGEPHVGAAADPWKGARAEAGTGLQMSWRSGSNRYALTAYPTVPPHAGAPRPVRRASLAVTDVDLSKACASPARPAARDPDAKPKSKAKPVHFAGRWKPPPYPVLTRPRQAAFWDLAPPPRPVIAR